MRRNTMNGAVRSIRPSDRLIEKSHIGAISPKRPRRMPQFGDSRYPGAFRIKKGRKDLAQKQHREQGQDRRYCLDQEDADIYRDGPVDARHDDAAEKEDLGRLAAATRPQRPNQPRDEETVIEPL